MGQDPSQMYSGPYRDPADNLAHNALMNAGKTSEPSAPPTKQEEAEAGERREKALDVLTASKRPSPPRPAPPKPEAWMYDKASYSMAHQKRLGEK